MLRKVLSVLLAALFILTSAPVSAQTPTPTSGLIYIVQEGDSLWDIAARFGVTIDAITAANNMTSQDIFIGDRLIIPSPEGSAFEGLSGILETQPVPFGETFTSLSRQYDLDPNILRGLNHLVSPAEVYAGYELVIVQQEGHKPWTAQASLQPGQTLLEMAVNNNSDPWTLAKINQLNEPVSAIPGDILYLPAGNSTTPALGLPSALVSAEVNPLPLVQGATAQIKITTAGNAELSASLGDYPLHFFADPVASDMYEALQGIHGMQDPGLYPLHIDAHLPDGSIQSFEQPVLVKAGNFISEAINGVEPDTIDPAVTAPEDEWLVSMVTPVTDQKYWQGLFTLPVDPQYCIRSFYGNRRSYNSGVYHSFHSGVDYGVCSEAHPFDIYAPADGVVVYTGEKTVRGNATIIDHGHGVYSGIYHQSEILVNIGDFVSAGQLIGKIGATGRVTGAHLHWDLFVSGVQVDPLTWLETTFPH